MKVEVVWEDGSRKELSPMSMEEFAESDLCLPNKSVVQQYNNYCKANDWHRLGKFNLDERRTGFWIEVDGIRFGV